MKKEPLYLQIKKYLLELIEKNRKNADYLLPSESKLCLKFGASREPVRKALSELETEGSIIRKQGKGAYINDNMQASKNSNDKHLLALILPEPSSSFTNDIIVGVRDFCLKTNNRYILLPSFYSSTEEQINILLARKIHCDGLLLMPVDNDAYNDALLSLIVEKMPCIFIDRKLVGLAIPSVSSDHVLMGYSAAKKLLDLGCRKIALFTLIDQITSVNERVQGYRQALSEYGITDEYVVNVMGIKETILHEKLQFFLQKLPEIDGIIINSGVNSACAIHALRKLGRKIGEDIQMVVFDEDNSLINMSTDIKTDAIVQDGIKIGYTACELLIQQIETNVTPVQRTLIPLLKN